MNYWIWSELYHLTWMRILTLLVILSVIIHAWIGMWMVFTDYLTQRALGRSALYIRLLFQIACILALLYYLVWGIQILWGL